MPVSVFKQQTMILNIEKALKRVIINNALTLNMFWRYESNNLMGHFSDTKYVVGELDC